MKQLALSLPLKPLSIALVSLFSLNAHSALYEVIDIERSSAGEPFNFSVAGATSKLGESYIAGNGTRLSPSTARDPNEEDESELLKRFRRNNLALYSDELSQWQRLRVWDERASDNQEFTETTDALISDVNDSGVVVGYASAPYRLYEWTEVVTGGKDIDRRAILRQFSSRAFAWRIGNDESDIMPVLGDQDEYGGFSQIYDINNNGLAIGLASVAINPTDQTRIDDCIDDGKLPELVCTGEFEEVYSRMNGAFLSSAITKTYAVQPYVWQLSSQLNTASTGTIGTLIDPDGFVTDPSQTTLNAVNDNGFIVGQSIGYADPERSTFTRPYAAIFTAYSDEPQLGDGAIDITDREIYISSEAKDINNNNLVVGEATRLVGLSARTKAFYYDLNDKDAELTEIPSVFASSSSTVNAVNSESTMVGEFEWEPTTGSSIRGTHAYVYQVGSKELLDLNEAVDCNYAGTITKANDIRDDGLILATTLLDTPLFTSSGEPILDSDGKHITSGVTRSVVLRPIEGGQLEECEDADQPFPTNERQGAGMGFMLLLLLPISVFRRFRSFK